MNFNHCARFVFLSRTIDETDSSSNIQVARAHAASGVHHTPECNMAFHLACSSSDVGLLSSTPSCFVVAAALAPPPPLPPPRTRTE